MIDMFKHKFEGDELLQVQYMEEEVESKKQETKIGGDDREEDEEDSPPPLEVKQASVGYGYDGEYSGFLLLRCPLKVVSHKDNPCVSSSWKESVNGLNAWATMKRLTHL